MNYSITINGEKSELADALAILKTLMGDQIAGGAVTANLAPQPAYQHPTQQQQPVAPQQPYGQPQQPQQPQQPYVQPQQPQQPYGQPQQQPAPVYPQTTVPVTEQTYTMDQLAVAGTQLVDAGRMAELQSLLSEFGVAALTMLPKEHYGAFATRLRALGAKI